MQRRTNHGCIEDFDEYHRWGVVAMGRIVRPVSPSSMAYLEIEKPIPDVAWTIQRPLVRDRQCYLRERETIRNALRLAPQTQKRRIVLRPRHSAADYSRLFNALLS